MTNSDAVDWLAQEIVDLVEMSAVGLYEFIWTLRGRFPVREFEWYRQVAEQALPVVLARVDCRLVWLVWPSHDVVAEHPGHQMAVADWGDPTEVPYLALMPAQP